MKKWLARLPGIVVIVAIGVLVARRMYVGKPLPLGQQQIIAVRNLEKGQQLTTADLDTDTWYNIALIRDSSAKDVYLYLDDSLLDTYSYTTQPEGYNAGEMSIGGYTGAKFEGSIDEFAIFNSQLTSQDVADIYNAAQVPEPATIALLGLGTFLLRKKRYLHHAA